MKHRPKKLTTEFDIFSRSVGGIRASLYNAISLEETQILADWMQEFQKLKQN